MYTEVVLQGIRLERRDVDGGEGKRGLNECSSRVQDEQQQSQNGSAESEPRARYVACEFLV